MKDEAVPKPVATEEASHMVTRILLAANEGKQDVVDELIPLVYRELRHLASIRFAAEKPGHTLQPTALVNEAYLRLIKPDGEKWIDSRQFFAAAAEAMRRILIESARRKKRIKRGGHYQRTGLDPDELALEPFDANFLDLNAALDDFREVDPESTELLKLHYFAGLTLDEAAGVLMISPRTADNRIAFARAWLYRHLKEN